MKDLLGEYSPAPQEASGRTLPPMIDAGQLIKSKPALPPELVSGLLHQGSKLILGGSSKGKKTWTLMDFAVSVSHGVPWLGLPTVQSKVLYLNFEIGEAFFSRRLEAVAAAKGIKLDLGNLFLWNLRGFAVGHTEILPEILKEIRGLGFGLIVVDPMYKLYGGLNENAAGDVAILLNDFEKVAVESGAAIAFGAHYSKGNQAGKESMDRMSGSGVFARDADAILAFTAHEQADAFIVEPTLRNFKPMDPFVVRWEFPLMKLATDLDPARLKQPPGKGRRHLPDALLVVLGEKRLATEAWKALAVSQTGMSGSTFYTLHKELKGAMRVRQGDDGRWEAANAPLIQPGLDLNATSSLDEQL